MAQVVALGGPSASVGIDVGAGGACAGDTCAAVYDCALYGCENAPAFDSRCASFPLGCGGYAGYSNQVANLSFTVGIQDGVAAFLPPVPADGRYAGLLGEIDFSGVVAALVAVATLVVGVLVVTRGARWIKDTISYESGGGDFEGARSVDPYLDPDGYVSNYPPEDWTLADLADASKRGDYGASDEFERRWRESIEP